MSVRRLRAVACCYVFITYCMVAQPSSLVALRLDSIRRIRSTRHDCHYDRTRRSRLSRFVVTWHEFHLGSRAAYLAVVRLLVLSRKSITLRPRARNCANRMAGYRVCMSVKTAHSSVCRCVVSAPHFNFDHFNGGGHLGSSPNLLTPCRVVFCRVLFAVCNSHGRHCSVMLTAMSDRPPGITNR